MKYTFNKGCHVSIPRTPKYFVDKTWARTTFTYDSLYDISNENQSDWNKLHGIATNPLNHADNTAFVAWRYWNNQIEIAPYFNINGTNVFTNDYSQILTSGKINKDKNFKFVVQTGIDFTRGEMIIAISGDTRITPIPNTLLDKFRKWKSVRVQPYFGGNETPNKNVSLELEWL